MADPKAPPSFKDALSDAAQAIAGGVSAPDYDPKFAGMMLQAISMFVQKGNQAQHQAQPAAAGGPGAPSPSGGSGPTDGAGAPGSPPGPTGDSGSAPPGGGAQTPPAAPTAGGMTQGLTPSPDELRRVLSDVAGK